MSQPHTRKAFLAQLLGAAAFIGFAPKLSAKPAPPAAAPASPAPFAVRPETRAVARQG